MALSAKGVHRVKEKIAKRCVKRPDGSAIVMDTAEQSTHIPENTSDAVFKSRQLGQTIFELIAIFIHRPHREIVQLGQCAHVKRLEY